MEIGRYYGMSDTDYHALPGISATQLKTAALHGLAELKRALDGIPTTTKAQRIGWLCHLRVNSPEDWARVAYPPAELTDGITTATGKESKRPTATAEYQRRLTEWEEQHPNAIRITREELLEVERITDALICSSCYKQCDDYEVVILFEFMGMQAKARLDGEVYMGFDHYDIYDWKFVTGTRDFGHKLIKWGYHMQAAFYLEACRAIGDQAGKFYLVGIDKETASPAYTVCAPVSQELLDIGLEQCRVWAEKIKEAKATDCWPGADSPSEWQVPTWYRHQLDQQVSDFWMP